jgi:hypothetical protein
MSGVKGRSGGRRKGAGRKPKAVEVELAALLDSRWPREEREKAISTFAGRAAQGDLSAFQLLLGYAYGRPTERHQHSHEGDLTFEVDIGGGGTTEDAQ